MYFSHSYRLSRISLETLIAFRIPLLWNFLTSLDEYCAIYVVQFPLLWNVFFFIVGIMNISRYSSFIEFVFSIGVKDVFIVPFRLKFYFFQYSIVRFRLLWYGKMHLPGGIIYAFGSFFKYVPRVSIQVYLIQLHLVECIEIWWLNFDRQTEWSVQNCMIWSAHASNMYTFAVYQTRMQLFSTRSFEITVYTCLIASTILAVEVQLDIMAYFN